MRTRELKTAEINVKKRDGLNYQTNKGIIIIPTFADVHVHLREPGFFFKETIKTGTKAAAKGGYGCLLAMPNLNPVSRLS